MEEDENGWPDLINALTQTLDSMILEAMEGYNRSIETTREDDFSRLTGVTYLDHAGATLYADSQLVKVHHDLKSNMYGNPHSSCASSRLATDTVEQVRCRILQHFNTSPECHSVIFTSGCTAALKLLAENFDWASQNSQNGPSKTVEEIKNPPNQQNQQLEHDNLKEEFPKNVSKKEDKPDDQANQDLYLKNSKRKKNTSHMKSSVEEPEDQLDADLSHDAIPKKSTKKKLMKCSNSSPDVGKECEHLSDDTMRKKSKGKAKKCCTNRPEEEKEAEHQLLQGLSHDAMPKQSDKAESDTISPKVGKESKHELSQDISKDTMPEKSKKKTEEIQNPPNQESHQLKRDTLKEKCPTKEDDDKPNQDLYLKKSKSKKSKSRMKSRVEDPEDQLDQDLSHDAIPKKSKKKKKKCRNSSPDVDKESKRHNSPKENKVPEHQANLDLSHDEIPQKSDGEKCKTTNPDLEEESKYEPNQDLSHDVISQKSDEEKCHTISLDLEKEREQQPKPNYSDCAMPQKSDEDKCDSITPEVKHPPNQDLSNNAMPNKSERKKKKYCNKSDEEKYDTITPEEERESKHELNQALFNDAKPKKSKRKKKKCRTQSDEEECDAIAPEEENKAKHEKCQDLSHDALTKQSKKRKKKSSTKCPEVVKANKHQDISHNSSDLEKDPNHQLNQDFSDDAMPNKAGFFCYLMDNHTSVVGMREIAKSKGADVLCTTYQDIKDGTVLFKTKSEKSKDRKNKKIKRNHRVIINGRFGNCLFAYPAQSNFSGAKYPFNLVNTLRNHPGSQPDNWAVLLDAASLVSTSPLDLSECEVEFVSISFYKIFGFPTGLGALIVRNDAARLLRKSYFGGGTVQAYLARRQFNVPKPSLSDQFEDGTLPFLDIVALKHGFDTIERLAGNMRSISDHTFTLAKYVHHKMASYHHSNGTIVAKLYCDNAFESKEQQGPIINFNLLRASKEYVGYAQVERLASLHGIHLRTGCFCNTGACQQHVGLTDEQILNNFQAGHVCGDEMDLIHGQPTGSVRISFGYMSTLADADTFLKFVEECFIEKPHNKVTTDSKKMQKAAKNTSLPEKEDKKAVVNSEDTESRLKEQNPGSLLQHIPERDLVDQRCKSTGNNVLTNIFLYPVKSCGAFEVEEWEMGAKGLLYDRHWMVVNDNGVCLSQKREERLCLIRPSIDLRKRSLWLHCRGCDGMRVPLDVETGQDQSSKNYNYSKVCMDRVKTLDCGDEVADWLTATIGRQCRLLRQNTEFERSCKLGKGTVDNGSNNQCLSLVNESPFTLLCRPSAHSLLEAVRERNRTTNNQPTKEPPLNNSDLSQPITPLVPQSGDKEEWSDIDIDELIGRFRGNLVIDGFGAFEEDEWKKIQIGDHVFTVAGVCIRCQMVCVDQETAARNKEPLLTLSSFRGRKVPFGIHLLHDQLPSEGATLCVGDNISVLQHHSLEVNEESK